MTWIKPPFNYGANKADWSIGDSFLYFAALGKLEGVSSYNKFGENPDIDITTVPEDIWDQGGTYTYSTTADIDTISSSSALDTGTITVEGLDENWDYILQELTLTGQAKVALTTNLIRCFRMYNTGAADFVGTVYVYVNGDITDGVPDVETTIRAIVINGNNQTLMCIYTVPRNKTAMFLEGYVALSNQKDGGAVFSWRARPFGGVFQVKSRLAADSGGSSSWSYRYGMPVVLPEKTDIKVVCDSVTKDNTAVSGGFDILLFDNTLWDL